MSLPRDGAGPSQAYAALPPLERPRARPGGLGGGSALELQMLALDLAAAPPPLVLSGHAASLTPC